MKPLSFILLLLVGACQLASDQNTNLESLIAQIASDELYNQYQLSLVDHQNNIIAKKYDIQGITNILKEGKIDICVSSNRHLERFDGGLLYTELVCKKIKLMEKLMNKYPSVFKANPDLLVLEQIRQKYEGGSLEYQKSRDLSIQLFNERKNTKD